jgi:hypothetical protein
MVYLKNFAVLRLCSFALKYFYALVYITWRDNLEPKNAI